jgi:3-phytase
MLTRSTRAIVIAAVALFAVAAPASGHRGHEFRSKSTVRFATFNASVNRNAEGELVADLSTGADPQLRNVAEIIQRARPDVLLINEFDFVPDEQAARLFQRNYLSVPQNGARPVTFGYRFVAPSNTRIASGKDLDNSVHGGTKTHCHTCEGARPMPDRRPVIGRFAG